MAEAVVDIVELATSVILHKNQKCSSPFCQIHGIHMCYLCPYKSQKNGKSERMLCTLNNIMHTLFIQAHLPSTYWVVVLHMATHLLKIYPSTTLKNDTPLRKLY